MVTDTLVRESIDAGRSLLALLRRRGFPLTAAYWLRSSDDDSWKLVLATERATRDYGGAYLDLATWMSEDEVLNRQRGLDELGLEDISLVSPSERTAAALAGYARGMTRPMAHLRGTLVDGRYIDEAIVYKLPA